ncbi:MAG: PEP-CTERM sorting domain-containing protein, partial [Gammaproteobacteria bacterium]
VTIEGQAASACQGLNAGNNPASDSALNALFGTHFDTWTKDDSGAAADPVGSALSFTPGAFSFLDVLGDSVVVILKQSTHWAAYLFDLGGLNPGSDGRMDGTWTTASAGWRTDMNCKVNKQGALTGPCGGLSHGMVGGTVTPTDVPAPGTAGLLALGIAGLGFLRRKQKA